MALTPLDPNAGPTGGPGAALPASTSILGGFDGQSGQSSVGAENGHDKARTSQRRPCRTSCRRPCTPKLDALGPRWASGRGRRRHHGGRSFEVERSRRSRAESYRPLESWLRAPSPSAPSDADAVHAGSAAQVESESGGGPLGRVGASRTRRLSESCAQPVSAVPESDVVDPSPRRCAPSNRGTRSRTADRPTLPGPRP